MCILIPYPHPQGKGRWSIYCYFQLLLYIPTVAIYSWIHILLNAPPPNILEKLSLGWINMKQTKLTYLLVCVTKFIICYTGNDFSFLPDIVASCSLNHYLWDPEWHLRDSHQICIFCSSLICFIRLPSLLCESS